MDMVLDILATHETAQQTQIFRIIKGRKLLCCFYLLFMLRRLWMGHAPLWQLQRRVHLLLLLLIARELYSGVCVH